MNQVFFGLALVVTFVSACGTGQVAEPSAGVGRLRIEVACSRDADCPVSFECESETEHGATATFCQSHDEAKPDGSGAQCPAGYEVEVEHGTSFCKPHGGDDRESGGQGGEPGDDHGGHGAEPGDDHGGHGGEPGDDRGGHGGEPGDDHGGHGAEPGDDHGGHGAEPGDDHGGHGAEPGDDHGGKGKGKGKDDATP